MQFLPVPQPDRAVTARHPDESRPHVATTPMSSQNVPGPFVHCAGAAGHSHLPFAHFLLPEHGDSGVQTGHFVPGAVAQVSTPPFGPQRVSPGVHEGPSQPGTPPSGGGMTIGTSGAASGGLAPASGGLAASRGMSGPGRGPPSPAVPPTPWRGTSSAASRAAPPPPPAPPAPPEPPEPPAPPPPPAPVAASYAGPGPLSPIMTPGGGTTSRASSLQPGFVQQTLSRPLLVSTSVHRYPLGQSEPAPHWKRPGGICGS
jgi:hypothetical protein